jgi:pimeloyl-ACP methyl ester carboxylesterase
MLWKRECASSNGGNSRLQSEGISEDEFITLDHERANLTPSPILESMGARRLRTACWNRHLIGTATPLLIFNGVGMNLEVLEPLVAEIHDRPVLSLDMPGIGGSPEPRIPYSPQMAASWGKKLLTRYGLDKADVMGFSWGGAIAQQFAIQYPGLTSKLMLAGIGPGLPILPGQATYHFHLLDPLWNGQASQSHLLGAVSSADRQIILDDFFARLTPPSSSGYLYQILALSGWISAPALPLLNKRTLILMGDEDHIIPLVNGRWLAALIPSSHLVVIKGGGHLFMFSHVKELLSHLGPFLEMDRQVHQGAA